MKKIAAIVFLFTLLVTGSVLAEDGFKVFLGYSGGGEYWRANQYDSGGAYLGRSKGESFPHGPSGEVRFDTGPVFVRGMFDYQWGAHVVWKNNSDTKITSKELLWSGEGDFGYKVYNQNNVSLAPYIGGGYRYWKITDKNNGSNFIRNMTPYGTAGFNVTYEQPVFSVGFDAAVLLPFEGNIKMGNTDVNHDTRFGLGARAMVPVTYTLLPKKTNGFGIMLFAKPYFEYWDSWKSETATGTKYLNWSYVYGIKGGIGFSF